MEVRVAWLEMLEFPLRPSHFIGVCFMFATIGIELCPCPLTFTALIYTINYSLPLIPCLMHVSMYTYDIICTRLH